MADLTAVPTQLITDVADAVRIKRGTTEPIRFEDMAAQIGMISGGLPIGINAIDTGLIVQTSDQTEKFSIDHHLGVAPNVLILYDVNYDPSVSSSDNGNIIYSFAMNSNPENSWQRAGIVAVARISDGSFYVYSSSAGYISGFNRVKPTNTSVAFQVGYGSTAGYGLKAGHTYRWIFIA